MTMCLAKPKSRFFTWLFIPTLRQLTFINYHTTLNTQTANIFIECVFHKMQIYWNATVPRQWLVQAAMIRSQVSSNECKVFMGCHRGIHSPTGLISWNKETVKHTRALQYLMAQTPTQIHYGCKTTLALHTFGSNICHVFILTMGHMYM